MLEYSNAMVRGVGGHGNKELPQMVAHLGTEWGYPTKNIVTVYSVPCKIIIIMYTLYR